MKKELVEQAAMEIGQWETEELLKDPAWAETVVEALLGASQRLDIYINSLPLSDLHPWAVDLINSAKRRGCGDNFFLCGKSDGLLKQMYHLFKTGNGPIEAISIEIDKFSFFEEKDIFALQKLAGSLGFDRRRTINIWHDNDIDLFAIKQ